MKKLSLYLGCFLVFFAGIIILSLPDSNKSTLGPQKKGMICLNMIVKNESTIIEQCLNSVKGIVDYWVIVDTGSTDGTQKVIKNCLKDVPGELHERPWVNFEHNRNEALFLAKNKAAYTLFMDADEVLLFSKDFAKPDFSKDIYSIQLKQKDAADSVKWFMIKNSLNWKWKGILHETITCDEAKTQEMIKGVVNYSDTSLGARSKDPQKYLKDAAVLEKELKKDPNNSRYRFYLASCYLNANEIYLALENYKKRAEMNIGDPGEMFLAQLMTARLQEACDMPPQIVIRNYLKAQELNPKRAEPLFYLGVYYLNRNKPEQAYDTFQETPTVFDPKDTFFTQTEIYEWRLAYMTARAALELKKYPEMQTVLLKVRNCKNAPQDVLAETEKNLEILSKIITRKPLY